MIQLNIHNQVIIILDLIIMKKKNFPIYLLIVIFLILLSFLISKILIILEIYLIKIGIR